MKKLKRDTEVINKTSNCFLCRSNMKETNKPLASLITENERKKNELLKSEN